MHRKPSVFVIAYDARRIYNKTLRTNTLAKDFARQSEFMGVVIRELSSTPPGSRLSGSGLARNAYPYR